MGKNQDVSKVCPSCGGGGVKYEPKTDQDGQTWNFPRSCPQCGGSGRV